LAAVPPLCPPHEHARNGALNLGWEFGQVAERLTKISRELGMSVGALQRRSQATRLAMETVVAGVKVLALPPLPKNPLSVAAEPLGPSV
ncbi:MAG: hypothetical protein SNJ60_07160, partial [Pseudanabaenaceae cyanobacterium]